MDKNELRRILNEHYCKGFVSVELMRVSGNATYAAYTSEGKYFAKVIASAFFDTFAVSVDINLFLSGKGFNAPTIILTDDGEPFVTGKDYRVILYEFLETEEIDTDIDAEEVGTLVGQLHEVMKHYTGTLITRGKEFYIDRYIDILRKKKCPVTADFTAYGERLWNRVKNLPKGYSHGDLYCGNIERAKDGKLYVFDFDTSCIGFPTYDIALICNKTDYFKYEDDGLAKTLSVYKRFLPHYTAQTAICKAEQKALTDMLALYHFALQATIIEIHGLNCVDNTFFAKQLEWLMRWEKQCELVDFESYNIWHSISHQA